MNDRNPNHVTSYVAVVGKHTFWPNAKCLSFRDVKDNTFSTIFLVEIKNSGIHWMEPRDLVFTKMSVKINDESRDGISTNHDGDIVLLPLTKKQESNRRPRVLMGSGKIFAIPGDLSKETLRAMLTVDGGEKLGTPK